VTDADVVLGIINPSFFLGGRIPLDPKKAYQAIEERVAKPLGLSVLKAAAGIRQIIDQRMADLIRRVTLERGYDPQDFVLYAYGGAGPTHCASFGKELRLSQIVVPQTAGSHSAFGAVTSDARSSFILSHLMRTPPLSDNASDQLNPKEMEGVFQTLEAKGANTLLRSGVAKRNIRFDRYLHMRYRRQTHEVPVPIANGALSRRKLEEIIKRFEDEYEFRYGQGSQYREAGLEITHFRVEAIGHKVKPRLRARRKSSARREAPASRDVYFYEVGRKLRTKFYQGSSVLPGQKIIGPAVLEYVGTTVLIEPGQRAFIDPYLNVRIEP
jgi:N-methylhydantoinase A